MVARAVFRGPEKRLGNRVRIHIQLIYAPRDQHLWAATYERNLKEVQELQADAARDIAGEIKLELNRQQQMRLSNTVWRFSPPCRLAAVEGLRPDISKGEPEEWRAQGDDFRTFLSELVSTLPQSRISIYANSVQL